MMIEKTLPHQQISIPNLRLPPRQQSARSLHKINNHYGEFQHALNMLKTSVEELWRLELAQLQNQETISRNPSNIIFDLQVPSIYTCRAVLPMASETISSDTKDTASFNSPMTFPSTPAASNQDILSSRMNIQENRLRSSTQSLSSKQKSLKSPGAIERNGIQRVSGSDLTKYERKTALLHLKFHCPKHSN